MTSEIQVYALLPQNTIPDPDIVSWKWVPCLQIPLERVNNLRLSVHPYKWVRYAMGVVIGAEGELSSSAESLEIIDYNAKALTAEPRCLYYYTSDEERQRMFPIDPTMARTSVTSSSAPSTGSIDFCEAIGNRDGLHCVLSSKVNEYGCTAVHLIPHDRGDKYITAFTQNRSREPSNSDVIESINSVRNGLFLNRMTHCVLGKQICFLPTPNFAMTTADVDPGANATEKQYTTHTFDLSKAPLFAGVPPGTPLRTSDSPDWPPTILFDSIYATAVIYHFGTQSFRDLVSQAWGGQFHPDHSVSGNNDGELELKQQRKEARRRDKARTFDSIDMIFAIPYMFSPHHDLKAHFREVREKQNQEEGKLLKEKIESWRSHVPEFEP